MKLFHILVVLLVAVGGLNWGLIGLGAFMHTDWNVVHMLLGFSSQVEWGAYVLVGLATIWWLVMHPKECKICMGR